MSLLSRPAVAVALAAVTACSASSSSASHHDAGTGNILPPVSPCPSPPQTGGRFPSGLPAQVPHPAFATSPTYVADSAKGHRVLRFTTAMSLRDAAAFVETAYPAAGYQIIGGDSEQHEADIEFARGQLRGKTKLAGEAPCTTTWTVLTISPS